MKIKYIFLFLLLSVSLCSLERSPWFGDVYEFHFLTKYAFSRFSKVDGAVDQLTQTSNDHLLHFNLAYSPSLQWSLDADLEFIDTPRQSFGFRSVGAQARYLVSDDIIGDPVSLTVGGNFRIVSSDSLKDVSTLYHSNIDIEFNTAVGKEISRLEYWRFRVWGYGALGIANEGSPWIRLMAAFEGNSQERKKWGFFADFMHGYGNKTKVVINNFDGYAKIREKNLDLGFKYGHRLGVWGTLSLGYKRRVLAKRCPRNVNTLFITYLLPFAF